MLFAMKMNIVAGSLRTRRESHQKAFGRLGRFSTSGPCWHASSRFRYRRTASSAGGIWRAETVRARQRSLRGSATRSNASTRAGALRLLSCVASRTARRHRAEPPVPGTLISEIARPGRSRQRGTRRCRNQPVTPPNRDYVPAPSDTPTDRRRSGLTVPPNPARRFGGRATADGSYRNRPATAAWPSCCQHASGTDQRLR